MTAVHDKLKNMPKSRKIQLIIAILLTILAIAAYFANAWFTRERQIAELQKVKTPDLLYISAACAEDVKFFDISTINIGTDDSDPSSQMFPFAVAGEYVTSFTLQFSHTTNNPFTYKIYEGDILCTNGTGAICKTEAAARAEVTRRNAEEGKSYNFDKDVAKYEVKAAWSKIENLNRDTVYSLSAGDTIYILRGTMIKNGTSSDYLNATTENGRIIANNRYHDETYGSYNTVNKYAEPLYWQRAGIQSVNDTSGWGAKPFFKTFILDISWDREEISNKETDMLYVSAYRE